MNIENQQPPAASPPASDDFAQEVMDTLGVGDWDNFADEGGTNSPEPPAPGETGAGVDAPSPAPDKTPEPPVAAPAPAASEPAPATPQAATPPVAPVEPPAAPPALPVPDEQALRTQSLAAQVEALQQQLVELRASPQTATPQGQQPPAESGQPPVRRYNLTLPQPIQDGLLSEDPQQNVAAINTLVNDLGTIVHATVMAEVRQSFKGLLDASSATEQLERQTSTANAAQEDYYKKFEAHRNPLYLPLLQAESQTMAAEFPHLPWNDDYINALGARVNARVAAMATTGGFAPAPVVDPAAPPAPPSRPAPMMPSGNRGAVPGTAIDGSDLIEDTLGLAFEQ